MFSSACNWIGPQDSQPCCPCAMRDVVVKDGRYVRIQDLGPALPAKTLRERLVNAGTGKTLRQRLTVHNG